MVVTALLAARYDLSISLVLLGIPTVLRIRVNSLFAEWVACRTLGYGLCYVAGFRSTVFNRRVSILDIVFLTCCDGQALVYL